MINKYSIIIPYHSNEVMLNACLKSLIHTVPDDVEIIVVANNSNTAYLSFTPCLPKCKIIKVDDNLYYSAAVNLGAENAHGEYLIFCDTDTYYTFGWFENLASFIQRKNVGFASSKLISPTTGCIIDYGIGFTKFNCPHPYLGLHSNHPLVINSIKVQAACSANGIIKKELFQQIGGFDIDLGYSYADIDLCLKLREIGKETWCVNNSVVYHKGNSVISGMSHYLKADIKGVFLAKNASRYKVDMHEYYQKSYNFFVSNHELQSKYFLVDLTTIYDKKWHYSIFQNLLDIEFYDIYNCPYKERDALQINLYEILDHNIYELNLPIIYFVDSINSLFKSNHIWRCIRNTKKDLIIDRNANIIPFSYLMESGEKI